MVKAADLTCRFPAIQGPKSNAGEEQPGCRKERFLSRGEKAKAVMKSFLAMAVMAAMLALNITPSFAGHRRGHHPTSDQPPVGQDVYNLSDRLVGQLDSFIDLHGTPGIIINANRNFGGRKIVAPADDLGWRAKGGLLLVMSDASVARMPPYDPPNRRLPVW